MFRARPVGARRPAVTDNGIPVNNAIETAAKLALDLDEAPHYLARRLTLRQGKDEDRKKMRGEDTEGA